MSLDGKKNDYDTRDIFMRRALELAPKYSSFRKNPTITNITKKSWNDFDKEGYKNQYWDNEFTYSPLQKLYYSQKNTDFLNRSLRAMVKERMNVDIGMSNDRLLEERMHEAFHFVLDIHYHEKKFNGPRKLLRFAREGYEYKPEDDEERGVIKKPRYNREWRKFEDKEFKTYDTKELIEKINRYALDDMYDIVRRKILDQLNYHRMYNMTVYEKRNPTQFKDRPEDEGLVAQRRPANMNLFRVKPRTYDSNVFNLYRK